MDYSFFVYVFGECSVFNIVNLTTITEKSVPYTTQDLTILESYNIVIHTWQECNRLTGKISAMGIPVLNINLVFLEIFI